MGGEGWVLAVDVGTSHTVAVVRGPDERITPLLFDASPLLPSAVHAAADGLLVGQDAVRAGMLDPGAFEPYPKRRIDDSEVLLGETAYPVTSLLSALLARVRIEAERVAGGVPVETVLTHPAAWGQARRHVLAQAASDAGLPMVLLVPEPVAAATYLTEVLDRHVSDEDAVLVYDFGAGTVDVALVRRTGGDEGGWNVVSIIGLDDTGGIDLDSLVVAHIGRVVCQHTPGEWRRLDQPESNPDRRLRRMLWDDARTAKERLSRASSTTIQLPLAQIDVLVTRDEFEQWAGPLIDRTVDAISAALAAADIRSRAVDAVLLVGGSSRIPLVASKLHRLLGVVPTVTEQPELIVGMGAAIVAAGRHTAVPARPSHGEPEPATTTEPASAPPAGRPLSPARLRMMVVAVVVVLLAAAAGAYRSILPDQAAGLRSVGTAAAAISVAPTPSGPPHQNLFGTSTFYAFAAGWPAAATSCDSVPTGTGSALARQVDCRISGEKTVTVEFRLYDTDLARDLYLAVMLSTAEGTFIPPRTYTDSAGFHGKFGVNTTGTTARLAWTSVRCACAALASVPLDTGSALHLEQAWRQLSRVR